MPCCGWRNQAGRSQPGDWRISVGDEVKAAFKLLCVDPNTHTHAATQTYGIYTDIYKHTYYTYCKQKYRQIADRYTDTHRHIHPRREEHTVVDVPTDAERRQIAPFEGKAKSNTECDFCHCGVWL